MRKTQTLLIATHFATPDPIRKLSTHSGWTIPCLAIRVEKVGRLSTQQLLKSIKLNI